MTYRGADQFRLRLPDGMRPALKAAARANGRSINAEIVFRLGCFEARTGNVSPAEARHPLPGRTAAEPQADRSRSGSPPPETALRDLERRVQLLEALHRHELQKRQ